MRDARSGRLIAPLAGTRNTLWGNAVLSPDGHWLAAKLWEEPARLWNARTGQIVRTLAPVERGASPGSIWRGGSFAFSPSSRWLLVSSDRPTRLFRTDTGLVIRTYPQAGNVGDSPFSADGERFVTSEDRDATVWSVDDPTRISEVRLEESIVDATLSADGRLLVTAGEDGIGEIWETATERSLGELRGHGGRLGGAWFSPAGHSVATVGFDGDARVWRTRLGRPPRILRHGAEIYDLELSADGQTLLSGGDDGHVGVWPRAGKPLDLNLGETVLRVGFAMRAYHG